MHLTEQQLQRIEARAEQAVAPNLGAMTNMAVARGSDVLLLTAEVRRLRKENEHLCGTISDMIAEPDPKRMLVAAHRQSKVLSVLGAPVRRFAPMLVLLGFLSLASCRRDPVSPGKGGIIMGPKHPKEKDASPYTGPQQPTAPRPPAAIDPTTVR